MNLTGQNPSSKYAEYLTIDAQFCNFAF